jgi:hypothetical protein
MAECSAIAGPIRARRALGGAMIEIKWRWWIWLLVAMLIFVTIKSPSTTETIFGGLVHAFADVGNAIVRMVSDVRTSH